MQKEELIRIARVEGELCDSLVETVGGSMWVISPNAYIDKRLECNVFFTVDEEYYDVMKDTIDIERVFLIKDRSDILTMFHKLDELAEQAKADIERRSKKPV